MKLDYAGDKQRFPPRTAYEGLSATSACMSNPQAPETQQVAAQAQQRAPDNEEAPPKRAESLSIQQRPPGNYTASQTATEVESRPQETATKPNKGLSVLGSNCMAHVLCAVRQGARSRIEADKVHHPRRHKCGVHGGMLPVLDVALGEVPCVCLIQSPAYPPNTQADTLLEARICTLSLLGAAKHACSQCESCVCGWRLGCSMLRASKHWRSLSGYRRHVRSPA